MPEACLTSERDVGGGLRQLEASRRAARPNTGTPEWLLDVRSYWASLTAQPPRATAGATTLTKGAQL